MDKEINKEEKEFVDGLVKEQSVTNALQKLHRKPIAISVYRHTSLVEALETELFTIEEAMPKLDESKKIDAQKRTEEAKAELIKLEAYCIEGILSPLT